jgi:hypothetical protein
MAFLAIEKEISPMVHDLVRASRWTIVTSHPLLVANGPIGQLL